MQNAVLPPDARLQNRDGGAYWAPRHALVDLGQLIGLLATRLFLVIS